MEPSRIGTRAVWPRAALCCGALSCAAACGGRDSLDSPSPQLVGCPTCTVFVGGRIFDGENVFFGSVVVHGDRIERVLRGDVVAHAGRTIELGGKTLIPGLIDLHVHLFGSAGPWAWARQESFVHEHLAALLRSGVTTVLDLGSPRHGALALRQRVDSGAWLGPRLWIAGPPLTPPGGHPCRTGWPEDGTCAFAGTPAQAHEAIRELANDGVDVLKVVLESGTAAHPLPQMDAPTLLEVSKSADGHGLVVVAHISESADVEQALDAGVRMFAHVPVHDRLTDALARRMAAEGAVVIPTLAVEDAFRRVAHGEMTELAGQGIRDEVAAPVLEAWGQEPLVASMKTDAMREATSRRWANAQANARTCLEQGVRVVAGTDAGNPATFHGRSLHHELALYVQTGWTPRDAIRSATRGAADVLGMGGRGRIEAGAYADLVVVEGNPLESIEQLSSVAWVMVGGELLSPSSLSVQQASELVRDAHVDLAEGAACLPLDSCAPPGYCAADGRCRHSCEDEAPCSDGQACYAILESGAYCREGDGCDLLTQDCVNAAACIWLGEGQTACAPAGGGEAGAPCSSWGACARGQQCDRALQICRKICDPGASLPGCPEGESCVDHSAEAGMVAGACE